MCIRDSLHSMVCKNLPTNLLPPVLELTCKLKHLLMFHSVNMCSTAYLFLLLCYSLRYLFRSLNLYYTSYLLVDNLYMTLEIHFIYESKYHQLYRPDFTTLGEHRYRHMNKVCGTAIDLSTVEEQSERISYWGNSYTQEI